MKKVEDKVKEELENSELKKGQDVPKTKVNEKVNQNKSSDFTPEELKILKNRRERQQKIEQVTKDILTVLQVSGASLMVDPQSPIGNPEIKIVLNN